jgi:hypothetical protein
MRGLSSSQRLSRNWRYSSDSRERSGGIPEAGFRIEYEIWTTFPEEEGVLFRSGFRMKHVSATESTCKRNYLALDRLAHL